MSEEVTESTEQSAAIFEEDRKTDEKPAEESAEQTEAKEEPAQEASPETEGSEGEAQADEGGDGKEEEAVSEIDIVLPDGSSLDPVHADEIAALGTELGLSSEQAQAWLNRESEIVADMLENAQTIVNEQSQAAMDEISNQWLELLKNDPEIGGDKVAETAELSKRFVESYFPKELQDWLDETGFGNHPEAVRGFYKAAKDLGIGGDKFEGGNPAGEKAKKSDAELFYGKN